MLPKRSLLRFALLGCIALAGTAAAQDGYPTRPVTLVVPFPAGGSTDLVARVIAEKMTQELGQQVIVENKGGAGGNLGSASVAKADPDGYTILMGTVATHALNPAIYKKMPYDAVADFAPISLLVTVPERARGQQRPAGEERRGADRAAEGGPRQVQLCLLRQRHAAAPVGRAVQVHGRRRHGPHPLQGRRAGADRPARRARADHVRQPPLLDRLHQGGPAARARGDHGRARGLDARPADDRRVRACQATRPTPGTRCSRPPAPRPR